MFPSYLEWWEKLLQLFGSQLFRASEKQTLLQLFGAKREKKWMWFNCQELLFGDQKIAIQFTTVRSKETGSQPLSHLFKVRKTDQKMFTASKKNMTSI